MNAIILNTHSTESEIIKFKEILRVFCENTNVITNFKWQAISKNTATSHDVTWYIEGTNSGLLKTIARWADPNDNIMEITHNE